MACNSNMLSMPSLPTIRIGTRKSPLALAQANEVRRLLLAARPEISVELVPIVTSGDAFADKPLADIGGKGLFTKEIEEALFKGNADIAVHSVKDMQTVLPDGLVIGCCLKREDARDVLIGAVSFDAIPKGASFGTSSLRRAAQALMKRPDLKIVPLRGNIDTRLRKVEQGEIGATLLAVAGLKRLGMKIPPSVLPVSEFLPAVGQGAIAIECRQGDEKIRELLAPLSHPETEAAVACERAFLRALDGSCRTPIAGYATIKNGRIDFQGLLAAPDGNKHWRITKQGQVTDAESLGEAAGKELLTQRN